MDTQKIITALQAQYPNRKIIKLPDDNPTEILCETEPTEEHPEYSIAISVLGESVPHKHRILTEVYTIMKGELVLHIDDQDISMKEGDSYKIKPGTVHWATSEEVWIHVDARPGWTIEDHIIVDLKTGREHVRH